MLERFEVGVVLSNNRYDVSYTVESIEDDYYIVMNNDNGTASILEFRHQNEFFQIEKKHQKVYLDKHPRRELKL